MKRILTPLAIFSLFYSVLCGIAGIFMADGALHSSRRPLDAEELASAVQVARQVGSEVQNASVLTRDGADLKGWLIVPQKSNGSAVVLLHGMGDNRGGVLG